MPLMPVVLWTDALVFILIALGVGFALHARATSICGSPGGGCCAPGWAWQPGDPERLLPDRAPGHGPFPAAAGGSATGGRDPVRPRGPEPPGSGAASAARGQEKTYSAPFATHLFVKEAIPQPDGTVVRDFPRLELRRQPPGGPERARPRHPAPGARWGMALGLLLWGLLALGLPRSSPAPGGVHRRPGEAAAPGADGDPLAQRSSSPCSCSWWWPARRAPWHSSITSWGPTRWGRTSSTRP
jgi:peptide/nickel transport system permease protein